MSVFSDKMLKFNFLCTLGKIKTYVEALLEISGPRQKFQNPPNQIVGIILEFCLAHILFA
jgi:hypothetical protein